MSPQGADAARGGFRDQAAVLLLDALSDEGWECVELEPAWSEKVDISWTRAEGRRDVQVKSRSNSVGRKEIETWCKELAEGSSAPEKRLIVIGPLGSTTKQYGQHGGVAFNQLADRIAAVHASAINLLRRYVHERGDESLLGSVFQDLVTILDSTSMGGRCWTRSELSDTIRATLAAHRERRRRSGEYWHVVLWRTTLVRSSGMVFEIVRYQLTNRGSEPTSPQLTLQVTDSAETELMHFSVSGGFRECISYPENCRAMPYVVDAWLDGELVSPGDSLWWGFVFRRWGTVRAIGGRFVLSDPLMPMVRAHEARVSIVVEGLDRWVELQPPTVPRGASAAWKSVVDGSLGVFHAEWTFAATVGLGSEELETVRTACAAIGLEATPRILID